MQRRWWVTLLLVPLVALLLLQRDTLNDAIGTTKAATDEADHYGQGLKSHSYDRFGNLSQQLTANSSEYKINSDEVFFYQTELMSINLGQPSWLVTAGQAVIDGSDQLRLTQQVSIRQDQREGSHSNKSSQSPWANVVLTTDWLNYQSETRQANTDAPVIIRNEHLYIEAIGMNFDLEQQIITLKSNVTTRYEAY